MINPSTPNILDRLAVFQAFPQQAFRHGLVRKHLAATHNILPTTLSF
jgi:hypothetical protein